MKLLSNTLTPTTWLAFGKCLDSEVQCDIYITWFSLSTSSLLGISSFNQNPSELGQVTIAVYPRPLIIIKAIMRIRKPNNRQHVSSIFNLSSLMWSMLWLERFLSSWFLRAVLIATKQLLLLLSYSPTLPKAPVRIKSSLKAQVKLDYSLLQWGMKFCEGKLPLQTKEQHRHFGMQGRTVLSTPHSSLLFKSKIQTQRDVLYLAAQKS